MKASFAKPRGLPWDGLGVAASSLCLAHCLLLPVFTTFLPVLGTQFLGGESVHRALGLAILAISAAAFIPGYRRHRQRKASAMAAVGLALLLPGMAGIAALEEIETALTMAGGVLLIRAHLLNRSFCRTCRVCRTETGCRQVAPEE